MLVEEGKSSGVGVGGHSRMHEGNINSHRNNHGKRKTKERSTNGGQNEGIEWTCVYPQERNATGSMKDGIRPKIGLAVETTWRSKPFNHTKAERKEQQQHVPIEIRLGVDREDEPPYSAAAVSPGLLNNRTLWIGNLMLDWDEKHIHNFITSLISGDTRFSQRAPPVLRSVKLIRDKNTGSSSGYAFLEFLDHDAASDSLESLKDQLYTTHEQKTTCNVNWAIDRRRSSTSENLSLFVGDLSSAVSDNVLHTLFSSRYGDVVDARIIVDPKTGSSRGFGFITFGNAPDRNAALITMNGAICMGNRIRVAPAVGKKGVTADRGSSNTPPPTVSRVVGGAGAEMQTNRMAGADPGRITISRTGGGSPSPPNAGCTIFVGGLNYSVTEEMLWNHFSPFGLVDYVKIPSGRGCGFVAFRQRPDAEKAIASLQGAVVGSCKLRLMWGKTQQDKILDWNTQQQAACFYSQPFTYQYGVRPQINGVYYPSTPGAQSEVLAAEQQLDPSASNYGGLYMQCSSSPISPSAMTYSMVPEKQQCRVMNCITTGAEAYCHPSLTSMPTNMYVNRIEYVPQGFYTASPHLPYYSVAENERLQNCPISTGVMNAGVGVGLAGAAPLSDGKGSSGSDNNSSVAGAQEAEAGYVNSDILPNSSPISERNASKQPHLSASHVYSSHVRQESSTTSLQGGSLTAIEHDAEITAAMTQLKVEGRDDLCTPEIHA